MRLQLEDRQVLELRAEELGFTRESLAWFAGLTTTTVSHLFSGCATNTQSRWVLRRTLDRLGQVLEAPADTDAFRLSQNWSDLQGNPLPDRISCLLSIRQQLASGSNQPPCRIWRQWVATQPATSADLSWAA